LIALTPKEPMITNVCGEKYLGSLPEINMSHSFVMTTKMKVVGGLDS
jgi:hypothetical protein